MFYSYCNNNDDEDEADEDDSITTTTTMMTHQQQLPRHVFRITSTKHFYKSIVIPLLLWMIGWGLSLVYTTASPGTRIHELAVVQHNGGHYFAVNHHNNNRTSSSTLPLDETSFASTTLSSSSSFGMDSIARPNPSRNNNNPHNNNNKNNNSHNKVFSFQFAQRKNQSQLEHDRKQRDAVRQHILLQQRQQSFLPDDENSRPIEGGIIRSSSNTAAMRRYHPADRTILFERTSTAAASHSPMTAETTTITSSSSNSSNNNNHANIDFANYSSLPSWMRAYVDLHTHAVKTQSTPPSRFGTKRLDRRHTSNNQLYRYDPKADMDNNNGEDDYDDNEFYGWEYNLPSDEENHHHPWPSLQWICYQACGGAGDRLSGIIQAFYVALCRQRTFAIRWETPVPLQHVLQPNHIPWNLPPEYHSSGRSSSSFLPINAMDQPRDPYLTNPHRIPRHVQGVSVRANIWLPEDWWLGRGRYALSTPASTNPTPIIPLPSNATHTNGTTNHAANGTTTNKATSLSSSSAAATCLADYLSQFKDGPSAQHLYRTAFWTLFKWSPTVLKRVLDIRHQLGRYGSRG